ncbi:hypothetical protein L1887_04810 [Cichorium endivia]|nr:hypothetical protein L1887_04810 [Cichorium endivia]
MHNWSYNTQNDRFRFINCSRERAAGEQGSGSGEGGVVQTSGYEAEFLSKQTGGANSSRSWASIEQGKFAYYGFGEWVSFFNLGTMAQILKDSQKLLVLVEG